MDEPMEVDSTSQQPPFETLHLLQLVKDGQQKHGLRHSDYKRYSDYCKRRVRRLRLSLKFTNIHKCVSKHRAKFQAKKVTPDVVTDLRFVELLVYHVEHCWARGMEFKFASEDEVHARQKFAARLRLGKAVQLAQNLDSIAKATTKIDSLTKLEIQAYYHYISASFYLEKKQWQKSLEHYRQSKAIYEKLAKIAQDQYLITLYDNRCRELASMVKVSETLLFDYGGDLEVAASNIDALKLNENSMDIEKLISDAEATLSAKGNEQEKTVKVEKKTAETKSAKKKKKKSKKEPNMSKYIPTKPSFFDLALEQFKLPEQVTSMK